MKRKRANSIKEALAVLKEDITTSDPRAVEMAMNQLSSDLRIGDFIPTQSSYDPTLLKEFISVMLPHTGNRVLKICLNAESILSRWISLASSFAPKELLTAFGDFTLYNFQPAAQALVFRFLTRCLRCLTPDERVENIGDCHSLLVSSKPELLKSIGISTWRLLRDSLTIKALASVVEYLVNSPLSTVVAFLCERSANELSSVVFRKGSLQFIKEFLNAWKVKETDITPLLPRILEAINGKNNSDVSTGLEIYSLLIGRIVGFSDEAKELLRQIFSAVLELWEKKDLILAHKSGILNVMATLTEMKHLSPDELVQFLDLSPNLGTPVIVSMFKICGCLIENGIFFKGFNEFMLKVAKERDPLLFAALLRMLQKCLPTLMDKQPKETQQILIQCVNPVPRYFVEQHQILKVLRAGSKYHLGFSIDSVLREMLVEPHSEVVEYLHECIKEGSLRLQLGHLDWFMHSSELVGLIGEMGVDFCVETLSMNMFPHASVPFVMNQILIDTKVSKPSIETQELLLKGAICIVRTSLEVLGIEGLIGSELKSKEEENVLFGLGATVKRLFPVIGEVFGESGFGQLLRVALELFMELIDLIKDESDILRDLVGISQAMAIVFPDETTKLVGRICEIVSQSEFTERTKAKIRKDVSEFFKGDIPFVNEETSLTVSRTGIQWLNPMGHKVLQNHLEIAAKHDRVIVKALSDIEDDLPQLPTFLGLRDSNFVQLHPLYISNCIQSIPFNEWILEEGDEGYLRTLTLGKIRYEKPLNSVQQCLAERLSLQLEFVSKSSKGVIDDKFTFRLDSQSQWEPEEYQKSLVDDLTDVCELIYPGAPTSSVLVREYLIHAERDVLDEPNWNRLEVYVLSSCDDRFILGFLRFARRFNRKINIPRWLKYKANVHKRETIASVILLLDLIKKLPNDMTQEFIHEVLCLEGSFDHVNELFFEYFIEATKDHWVLLRHVVDIEPSHLRIDLDLNCFKTCEESIETCALFQMLLSETFGQPIPLSYTFDWHLPSDLLPWIHFGSEQLTIHTLTEEQLALLLEIAKRDGLLGSISRKFLCFSNIADDDLEGVLDNCYEGEREWILRSWIKNTKCNAEDYLRFKPLSWEIFIVRAALTDRFTGVKWSNLKEQFIPIPFQFSLKGISRLFPGVVDETHPLSTEALSDLLAIPKHEFDRLMKEMFSSEFNVSVLIESFAKSLSDDDDMHILIIQPALMFIANDANWMFTIVSVIESLLKISSAEVVCRDMIQGTFMRGSKWSNIVVALYALKRAAWECGEVNCGELNDKIESFCEKLSQGIDGWDRISQFQNIGDISVTVGMIFNDAKSSG